MTLLSGNDAVVRPRINRKPSRIIANGVPWIIVLLGTIVPSWLLIASAPVLPPLGFLMFLAWRQLRPGLLPMWAGLPLGLFEDLFSGSPYGTAVVLWSVAAIVLDHVENRLPWRNFLTEWLVAIALIVGYVILCLGISNLAGASVPIRATMPQIVISVMCYPLVGRFIALMDRIRLTPFVDMR